MTTPPETECGRRSPLHYHCSLPMDHPGPHEARGVVDDHLYERWSEEDAAEVERLEKWLTRTITNSSSWSDRSPNARDIAEEIAYYLRASGHRVVIP